MGIDFVKKFTSFLLILVFITSCGTSPEEEIKSNLVSAEILLSTSECQEAIDLLEGLGRQNKNARYLKLLASAYACRSKFSTIKFFADDIALTGTPAPLGGISLYSTSLTTFTSPLEDDLKFNDLQTAIDILLYAGGIATTTEPTSVVRATNFTERDASDINAQMAYMMLVQLGRVFKVYANASSAGVKGAGLGANVCFTDYPNVDPLIAAYITTQNKTGACNVINSSHAQLDSTLTTATRRRARLCQGIVLLNGILDVLPAIIVAAGGGELGDIGTVTTEIETYKQALENIPVPGGFTQVLNVLSQNNCETDTAISTEAIESYYAVIVEGLIK